MFTHLFDQFVRGVGGMPGPMVYGMVGLWVGAENVGIPLPLELILLFSGSLVALGELSFVMALITLVVASLAFAVVAYLIGRHAGTSAVLKLGRHFGLTQHRIDHIDAWLRHRGVMGVILARIIPGIRLFSSYVIGIAGIPPATFAVGAVIGTAGYISIWVVVGALLGENYRIPLRYFDRLGLFGLALVVAAIVGAFVLHRVLGHHSLRRLAVRHAALQAAVAQPGGAGVSAALPAAASWYNGHGLPRTAAMQSPEIPSRRPFATRTAGVVTWWGRELPSAEERFPDLCVVRQGMRAAAAGPWPTWPARALAGVWIAALALFLALAVAAHGTPAFSVDMHLSAQLQQFNNTPLGRPMMFLGDLQGPVGAAVAYVVLLGALAICRFFWEALCLMLAGLGAEASNILVNAVVARPRPPGDVTHTLANLGVHSFPSGHTADCVGLYGFVFYLTVLAMATQPGRSRWRPWLIAVQAVCAVFILNVGVSRVVEGQHWPSDVAGGYLLGGLFLVISIALYHRLAEREAGVAPHGVLLLVAQRVEPTWVSISSTTTRMLHDAGELDRRVAGGVGLRGPDLQAQIRRPWPSWVVALAAGVWTELATVALIVSVSAHRYAAFPVDAGTSAWVQHLRGTFWASLIKPAGDLQWYLPTAIAYVLIFATLLVLRLYLAAIFTAIATISTDVINVIINTLVNRPRPHGVSIATLTAAHLGQASFPSGHVAHTVGLYGFVFFLCVLALRARPAASRLRPWLLAIQALCVYFIVFVGVSRVLEGQHWPSDVAGGYLVGLTVLALVIMLYHLVAMRGGAGRAGVKSEQPVEEGVAAIAPIS